MPKKIPIATLTLALLITAVQILRSSGGSYEEFVLANLHHGSWELFYNQPWRILTSPFIHQNILHFSENLFFLLLFGWQIERTHGWLILLGVFFGALVTSYVIYVNVMHDRIIGISGGVCGMFGFSLIANRRSPWWTTLTHHPLHILYSANLAWAVIVDITNLVSYQVAHLNHLVGILYGMAFGAAFLVAPRQARWRVMVIALPLMLFATSFYSPWQVDWQMVHRPPMLVTTNADCRIPSTRQDTYISTTTKFVNESTKPVALYWLDYEGHANYYFWLRPRDSHEQQTYIENSWCIVDVVSGAALQATIVTGPKQTITLH
jgi:membrane associated rhomboid family serine protease